MAGFHVLFNSISVISGRWLVDWSIVWSLTAFSDSMSVYNGPSPREREKERNDRREKNAQTTTPHLLQGQEAIALLLSKLVGRLGTWALAVYPAPSHHPITQSERLGGDYERLLQWNPFYDGKAPPSSGAQTKKRTVGQRLIC